MDKNNEKYEKCLEKLEKAAKKTKFGRIEVWIDKNDTETHQFWENLGEKERKRLQKVYKEENLSQKRPRNAQETELRLTFELIWLLPDFIRENKESLVEFRRLSRNFIRRAKRKNADSLVLLSESLVSDKAARVWGRLGKRVVIWG